MVLYALVLFLSLTICHVGGQSPEGPTLLQNLTFNFASFNEMTGILLSQSVSNLETPIAIRYALVVAIPAFDVSAGCHPEARGFLGKRDVIPRRFCQPLHRAIIFVYSLNSLLKSQFPIEGRAFEAFLIRQGLDPKSTSTDQDTLVGVANSMADDIVAYLETDGWNSRGDLSRDNFRQQYSDYTGYKPQNHGNLDVSRLRRPLRWQPLTQDADLHGRFTTQVHVVPHIGRAKPLALSRKKFLSRRSESPYDSRNRKKTLSPKDERKMKALIREVLQINRNLTKEQVAIAHWWDNKFFSLGIFGLYYQAIYGFDDDTANILVLGEAMAQHDAVIMAWKEKARHDLVRPSTMIRRFFKGSKIRAFKNLEEGVGLVDAEEWEPVVRVQPHSEFPSASALVCMSTMDHLRAALKNIVKVNGTITPFEGEIPPFFPGRSPVSETVKVKFDTLEAAALSCGESRLDAGVHFSPSVRAGFKLSKGIGEAAQKHVQSLWEGRIPEDCDRCPDM